ncbi:DUF2635 domain-containing protein [Chelatococcus daeguensis]|uniref:DUF2635 domain-containing protein n=1 Tax=Chelatococcus sambhunathii TaxID=363953 RepID=A0ABM9U9R5_9HYPH|nr:MULTISPECIES: DUF2635 domain-containing protein [Chelatococcus]KZE34103.1 hypothetical protein AVW15_17465 [Chelatococcus daeguensis]MBM3082660.1 DUF2635 domain-containing protein [Chelatococcus daeguensis]CUA90915.1 Protein of unknown function (DUF2635) [Chelatococcus sambhunathii]
MATLFIRPAERPDGTTALVRQPERRWEPLPPEGRHVEVTSYWARRLRDGDVVAGEPGRPRRTRKSKG